MENQTQGNESKAHILILDQDGATVFAGRRTVRSITNDGITQNGKVQVRGAEYIVYCQGWKWTGQSPDSRGGG